MKMFVSIARRSSGILSNEVYTQGKTVYMKLNVVA